MAGSLVYRACEALRDKLEASAPALAGSIDIRDQLPEIMADGPRLVIRPQRFPLTPWQQSYIRDDNGDAIVPTAGRPLVLNGSYDGEVQLWLQHQTGAEHEFWMDQLDQAFGEEPDEVPAQIRVTVTDVAVAGLSTGWDARLAFIRGPGTEWREELVFSERRWSFLELWLEVPALSLQKNQFVPTQGITLVFDQDLDADLSAAETPTEKIAAIDGPEIYTITEDGIS